ncbi:sugar kinase [Bombilactobacillus bombi]|uniref:Sugar kinase n=1 Tax=Bombilactobacillus bombi TaxID=1303590 RepID=A0A3R6UUL0_9LACO|nr:sugar kinase [Bombilactobacillus bombi]RHW45636.1 sugar kinase [Bombilactobacillus bombi]
MAKIVAFGEIMLRLTVPNYLLLEQTNELQMSFTGTGVNVLESLAHMGHKSYLISTLPNNRLGIAAASHIRNIGIKDNYLEYAGDHLGSFFVELGYGNRPEEVTYQNRINSSFCLNGGYDFENYLKDADLIHICGISLCLTSTTRKMALLCAKKASELGKIVCFDFNFRPSLNKKSNIAKLMKSYREILQYCNIVFGSRRDLTELLGYSKNRTDEDIFKQFVYDYKLNAFCGTKRTTKKHQNFISGFYCNDDKLTWSAPQYLSILDRIGGGDAFAAGIIHSYLVHASIKDSLNYAVANSALAHAQIDDIPLASKKQILHFINTNGNLSEVVR